MAHVSKYLAGVGLLSAAAVLLAGSNAWGAITPEQQAQIKALDDQLREVGQLALAQKYDEAKTLLESIQGPIVALAANSDPEVKRRASPLLASLMARRRFLEGRGVTLAKLPEAGSPAASGTVSFTKDVAPILVNRCRNCHINNTRGMFSMATFERLMNGVGGAAVINPGSAQTSRLYELVSRGEMPPNGNVPQAELDILARWINEGARFDGMDPRANIATGQAAPPPSATPARPSIQQATGRETVLYSRDIAPVLVESCTGCHGGQQPRAQLGLDTFRRLVNGGDNGPILVQGNPAESLLIKKLKGTASGQRMPAGRAPLSAEVIAKFEKWIAEGAKFDGTDPNMQTDMVARIYAATQMSHEELARERVAMADRNWRLSSPGIAADRVETERHLLLGTVGEARLQEVVRLIDQVDGKTPAQKNVLESLAAVGGGLPGFRELPRAVQEDERILPPVHGDLVEDVRVVAMQRLALRRGLSGIEGARIRDHLAAHGEAALLLDHQRFRAAFSGRLAAGWNQQGGCGKHKRGQFCLHRSSRIAPPCSHFSPKTSRAMATAVTAPGQPA